MAQAANGQHNIVKRLFFFAQFLRFFGIVPNAWVFKGSVDRSQSFRFRIEVKDTPEDQVFALANR